MPSNQRLHAAAAASLKHLLASVAVASVCAALVFGLWYPYPYNVLAGGQTLFLLLISVDVAIGPLLTLVVFNPNKSRAELWRDIGVIVFVQLVALGYGLYSVIEARPVFLAYEGNRFRMVRVPDIDYLELSLAPKSLQELSLTGPRTIGVRLASPTDVDFPASIKLDLSGLHPSFRPRRWVDYQQKRQDVLENAKPVSLLEKKYPSRRAEIEAAIRKTGLVDDSVGYLPLNAGDQTDWVVLVSLVDAEPKGFLHLDGW